MRRGTRPSAVRAPWPPFAPRCLSACRRRSSCERPRRQGTLVVDAQTGRGAKIDPLTGLAPIDALDPNKPDPRARPEPLMAAYFASINQPNRVIYVDEFRNYLQRLSDQRDANDK